MEVGLIRKIDIDGEMQSAYLSYAMSVIASRALPDGRMVSPALEDMAPFLSREELAQNLLIPPAE